MREYGCQAVVWQTAINPVIALELLGRRELERSRSPRARSVRRGRRSSRACDRCRLGLRRSSKGAPPVSSSLEQAIEQRADSRGPRTLRRARRRDDAARRRARRRRARSGTSTAASTSTSPAGSAARTPATASRPRRSTSRSTATSTSASWSGCTSRTSRSAGCSTRLPRPAIRDEVAARELRRRGGRERRQDRAGRDRAARRDRVRPRLPRPDEPDDGDDGEGRSVQAGLRPVRARGLPGAGAVSVPRRLVGRRARRARACSSSRTSTPPPSRASCSSRCRARAASSRCPTEFPRAAQGALRAARDPLRRRRGAGRRRAHRTGLGDRALRRRARTCSCPGKSLGGGLPLAGVTGPTELMDAVPPGRPRRNVRRQPARLCGGDRGPRARSRARSSASAPRSSASASARGSSSSRRAMPRSARCAGSGRCSRSSSPSRTPELANVGDRGRTRARARAAVLRHLRERDPHPRAALDRRRAARARARHPGGVAWRRTRWLTLGTRRNIACLRRDRCAARSAMRKTYGDVVAVDRVDLEIPAGEFFTLLGPSGSGKTTTLRLIAGFERPDAGRDRARRRRRDGPRRPTSATSTPSSRTTRSSRT